NIEQIKSILKGNISSVIVYLKSLMKSYANSLKYEEAQEIKEKIEILERYKSKSTIVNLSINNLDVFSYLDDQANAYINYIKIVSGAIIQSHTVELKKKLDESKEDLLLFAMIDIRQKLYSESKDVVLPFKPKVELDGIKFVIPKKGDKLKLLQLSERNLKYYKLEKDRIKETFKEKSPINKILIQLKDDLRLSEIPEYIECFDNSNIQGTNPVAACVVFKEGKPLKSEYRHYNIKSVKGQDDYASIEEVVYRRYSRLINENHPLPQLIVIDGGKGQLSSAYKSLEKLNISKQIAIIGIAKKLEEIYVPKDSIPIYLNKNSASLKLLQKIRNEAHRFGIQFHRQKRSATLTTSEINNIKGVGSQTVEKLFKMFKNIENIKNASIKDLEKVIGKSKSKIITNYFNGLNNS
ncbi:MAG: excinuclease ABC subunit C, partial [Bacteroidales bacterium]|nr:excinuclease ABC subunit C [Bacteroidales bacterium]